MTNIFLKAKHWQLFLLTCVIPIISQIVMMGALFADTDMDIPYNADPTAELESMFRFTRYFLVMMILFTGVIFGWFWSIGVGLQKIIPPHLRLKVNRFKALLLLPAIYILFFIGVFVTFFASCQFDLSIFGIIVPLHLFSMFCVFYSIYFIAKTFKTAELQRQVTFSDFAGEFFMIWFYPVGIWIIQPKINNMIQKQSSTKNNS